MCKKSDYLIEINVIRRPLTLSTPTFKNNNNKHFVAYNCINAIQLNFLFFVISLKKLKNPHIEDLSSTISDHYSLLDLSMSIGNVKELNYSMSLPSSETSDEKMFADSAFQSLGDGLELEQDDNKPSSSSTSPPPSVINKQIGKLESPKLELQMKSIAEEAKSLRSRLKSRKTTDGNTSRFATQPVTVDELQKASKYKNDEDDEDHEGKLLTCCF